MIKQGLHVQATVIGSGLMVMIPALAACGVGHTKVFEHHGVDLSLVSDPGYRVPVSSTVGLWTDAARITGDEAFGLRAGSCAYPTMYHSLGIAMWSSSTSLELFESWIRHLPLINTAVVASLANKGDCYELSLNNTMDKQSGQVGVDIEMEAALAALLTICRAHHGKDFAPLAVELMRKPPVRPEAFDTFFSCPVEYSASQITLRLDRERMDAPIPLGNPLLKREMEQLSFEYILRMDDKDLISKLRKTLLEQLPNGGADQERVADALHMSARTLHRKLRSEGTSYREQLDEVRCELSLQYMRHQQLSMMDIAFRLGFSNCSNFARAFKRWVGKTPNEYRAAPVQGADYCFS